MTVESDDVDATTITDCLLSRIIARVRIRLNALKVANDYGLGDVFHWVLRLLSPLEVHTKNNHWWGGL